MNTHPFKTFMFQRRDSVANARLLEAAGYFVGERDPRRNTSFHGKWMVAEPIDEALLPTTDASRHGFCIVGDDLEVLVNTAAEACLVEPAPPAADLVDVLAQQLADMLQLHAAHHNNPTHASARAALTAAGKHFRYR